MRILVLLLVLFSAPSALAAICNFESGSASVLANMALPATLSIPRNATNGTPLWDSGWKGYSSTTINCTATGTVKGMHAGGIGAPVAGYTSNGFPSVFETNVPGIGVSVFWCNQVIANCNPDPTKITPLPSLAWNVLASRYPLSINWRVRLIKTADIDASAGTLSVAGLSAISYVDVGVTTLSITGTSRITGLGCEVNADSRNIDVRLPTIAKTDFAGGVVIPQANDKARAFKINLQCDSGVKVSYQIDGNQTSAGSSVLANAAGAGMATGVGVSLFMGDLSSVTRLPLGTKFLFGATSSAQPMSIPLTARYHRTAASAEAMGAGLVSTTATFTLFYE